MIVLIEILLITILGLILVTLALDEKTHRRRSKHLVGLKGYWNGENRRRVIRHNTTLDVHYKVNHHKKISKSRNISTRGVGLVLDEKLERNTPLSVEIRVNGQASSISAKALVMWCKEVQDDKKVVAKRLFHTGIKFIRFTDAQQEKRLFDYIRTIEDEEDTDTHL